MVVSGEEHHTFFSTSPVIFYCNKFQKNIFKKEFIKKELMITISHMTC